MKVRLVHDESQRAWQTDESPGPGQLPVELDGAGGKFTVLVECAQSVPQAFDVLTVRQRSVAMRDCGGLTTQAIAEALGIATETVRSHLKNIYRRLGVAGRTELVRVATGDLVLGDLD